MKHLKKYESLGDEFNQYKEYQVMVNLIYNARNSVFIVNTNGQIDVKYWRENGTMFKKDIDFIYEKLKDFNYVIYSGEAVLIYNIQPDFFDKLKEEYDLLISTKKYNL